ncbi:hypothetical protein A9Q84_11370 [Halobacteriovorax marinus]|uniref:Pentapeptide repeat-containing protein n=1 Tax=Halobacteriovorax marinus TaxID=97084 RepID=A0A1Y5F7P2_9BACT|nr:hypothetical protein A9Q84_11370 [Halobacteriovorax marinus]
MSFDKTYFEGELIDLSVVSDFENMEFIECQFTSLDLTGFSFKFSKLIECHFTKCNLSNANMANTSLRDVQFIDSKLLGINWSVAQTTFQLSFLRSILDLCVFQGLDLVAAKFIESSLKEVDFSDSKLMKASFAETDLLNTIFNNSNLAKADLRGALNYYLEPEFTVIKNARFSMPEAMGLFKGLGIIVE